MPAGSSSCEAEGQSKRKEREHDEEHSERWYKRCRKLTLWLLSRVNKTRLEASRAANIQKEQARCGTSAGKLTIMYLAATTPSSRPTYLSTQLLNLGFHDGVEGDHGAFGNSIWYYPGC